MGTFINIYGKRQWQTCEEPCWQATIHPHMTVILMGADYVALLIPYGL
jgi:hypothetical protein